MSIRRDAGDENLAVNDENLAVWIAVSCAAAANEARRQALELAIAQALAEAREELRQKKIQARRREIRARRIWTWAAKALMAVLFVMIGALATLICLIAGWIT